jgi:hypothetical protein
MLLPRVRYAVHAASSCSSAILVFVLAGCFSPDLGQGVIRCGEEQSCPPGFQCVRGFCWSNGADLSVEGVIDMSRAVDLAGAAGDLNMCVPTMKCNGFCGTIADDGCGHSLRCDCSVPNTCSSKTKNSCECTPIKSCSELPDIHCGRYPDGCGGFVTCPNCPGQQICGAAPNPYTCGNQTLCQGRLCLPGQCGIIANDCNDIVICPDCPFPKVCGGGGRANWCD